MVWAASSGRPLGTAGAVYAAVRELHDEPAVVVLPADTLFPFQQLPTIAAAHAAGNAAVTWAVTTQPGPGAQNAGRLRVNEGRIMHAAEQHTRPISASVPGVPATSVGAMAVDTAAYRTLFARLVDGQPSAGPVDLYRDLAPWMLRTGYPVAAWDIGCPAPDLGTPGRLRRHALEPVTLI